MQRVTNCFKLLHLRMEWRRELTEGAFFNDMNSLRQHVQGRQPTCALIKLFQITWIKSPGLLVMRNHLFWKNIKSNIFVLLFFGAEVIF